MIFLAVNFYLLSVSILDFSYLSTERKKNGYKGGVYPCSDNHSLEPLSVFFEIVALAIQSL
jgi:hypothetical protein